MLKIQPVHGITELQALVPEWERLIPSVIEPNVFYEPFMLLPAVVELGRNIVTLFVRSASGELLGVFPLQRQFFPLAVPHYTVWKHPYCYLCTPLIRVGAEQAVLQAVFAWMARAGPSGALLQFRLHPLSGPFDQALQRFVQANHRILHTSRYYERPLVQTTLSPEAYQLQNVSSQKRKQLRRLRRRLSASGTLAFQTLRSAEEMEQGISQFIALEHKGWKGREGSSFASRPQDRAFLVAMVHQGALRGQVELRVLSLNQTPIAMGLTLRSGRGAFAFKIAYDEDHAANSPGVLLDMEMFRELLVDPGLSWVDSCSDPDYPMDDPQWGERRAIRVAHVSSASWSGRALGAAGLQFQALAWSTKAWIKQLDPELQERLKRFRRVLQA